MRGIVKVISLAAVGYLGSLGLANADVIDNTGACGDASIGTRQVRVTPVNDGGFCYAQLDNLQEADYDDIGLPSGYQLIDKNNIAGEITYDINAGTWSLTNGAALWNEFDELFLGFHFGGGGECGKGQNPPAPCDLDPDSFVVGLLYGATNGTFELIGGKINGLSNIYLFGVCTEEDKDCRPPLDVPEPGTLGLLGLGLAGLGFGFRRRRKI